MLSGTQPFGIQPGARLTTGSMIDELAMLQPHGVLLNGARAEPRGSNIALIFLAPYNLLSSLPLGSLSLTHPPPMHFHPHACTCR